MKKQQHTHVFLSARRKYIVYCCLLLSLVFCLGATTSPVLFCNAHPVHMPAISQQYIQNMPKQKEEPTVFIFHCQGPTYTINEMQLTEYFQSNTQPKFVSNGSREQKVQMIKRITQQGFTLSQSMAYVYPSLSLYITWLRSKVEIPAQNAQLQYYKNTKKVIVQPEKQGRFVHIEKLYADIFEQLQTKRVVEIEVPMQVEKPQITQTQAKAYAQPMATFATKFATSNVPRSHNIAQALRAFDGYILPPQAEVSFNKTTGVRNQQNGYLPAKIIQNGTYVEGYGGGVCQASTTLYNAALLSGLTITEVHAHSLQVGYVQAGFDAMVNIGSSDLKIKNPFPYPVLFSTKVEDGTCQVTVYGKPSGLTIERQSKVVKTLPAPKPKIKKANTYNGEPLYLGQQVWQTYGKAGAQTQSYIHIYKNGKKIDTQKIRENYYASTQGVIIEGAASCVQSCMF